MNKSKTILVTGATGWIGRKVCEALQAQGVFVWAADLQESVGPWDGFVRWDITNPVAPSLEHLCGGSDTGMPDAVIHCAGLAHRPVETEEVKQQMFEVNAEGTRHVVAACARWGIERLVYISSIAFYDWSQEGALNEDAALSTPTAYAASKLEGEKVVLDSGLDGRVVRLATVFGEGDPANFAKLAVALKAGRFLIPGKGEASKSVIPVGKAADCLAELALRPDVPYQLINLGLASAPSLDDICEAFTQLCDFPKPKSIPLPLFRLLALIGDMVSYLKPGFPLTRQTLGKLTTSTEVDCRKAVQMFPRLEQSDFSTELSRCADFYRDL